MPLPEVDLNEKQLKWGIWFLEHKATVKKAVGIILIVLNIGLWGYSFYGLADYLAFHFGQEKILAQAIIRGGLNWPALNEAVKPAPLEWSEPFLISERRATDFFIQIQNANRDWLARFSFLMSVGDETSRGEDFVLPGQKKYLFKSFRDRRGAPSFTILDIKWERIDVRQTEGGWDAFYQERLNFSFDKIKFLPASQGLPERVEFEVWNKSAFGFWQPKFLVLLWRGEKIVSASNLLLEKFKSGEKREASLSLIDSVGAVSKVEIVPDVNILDSSVYMLPGAEAVY